MYDKEVSDSVWPAPGALEETIRMLKDVYHNKTARTKNAKLKKEDYDADFVM